MNSLKSHVVYDARKRRGILFFACLLGIMTIVLIWYDPGSEIVVSEKEELEVLAFQQEIDSLSGVYTRNDY